MELVKYGNRKLYDRKLKSYTTLTKVVEAVRAGEAVVVTDHGNGKDITRDVLTEAAFHTSQLTTERLTEIIKSGNA